MRNSLQVLALLALVSCGSKSPAEPTPAPLKTYEGLPAVHELGNSGLSFELTSIIPDRGTTVTRGTLCKSPGVGCLGIHYNIRMSNAFIKGIEPSTPCFVNDPSNCRS